METRSTTTCDSCGKRVVATTAAFRRHRRGIFCQVAGEMRELRADGFVPIDVNMAALDLVFRDAGVPVREGPVRVENFRRVMGEWAPRTVVEAVRVLKGRDRFDYTRHEAIMVLAAACDPRLESAIFAALAQGFDAAISIAKDGYPEDV